MGGGLLVSVRTRAHTRRCLPVVVETAVVCAFRAGGRKMGVFDNLPRRWADFEGHRSETRGPTVGETGRCGNAPRGPPYWNKECGRCSP